MESILTTKTLWEGYDPTAEQLDTDVFKQTDDEIITKKVYFTGSNYPSGNKTRVFGIVCYKNTKSTKPAVLVVGDYHNPIDLDCLQDLAKQGFVAMAIDYVGRSDSFPYTIYAQETDYCNKDVAKDLFDIEPSIKDTKLCEYCRNTMRAITYLATEEHTKSISLVTEGKGAFVGLIVLGVDKRIERGAVLFGNLHHAHPWEERLEEGEMKNEDALDSLKKELEIGNVIQHWDQALAPQAYLQQITAPLYVVNSATSVYVNLKKISEMYFRLNEESRLLLLPTVMDYVPSDYAEDVVRWLKGSTVEEDTEISSFVDEDGDYCLKVTTSATIKKTSLWYCTQDDRRAKHWSKAVLTKGDNCYVAKLDLYTEKAEVLAFATIDGAISYSTSLFHETVVVPRHKPAGHILFVGRDEQQVLIPIESSRKWWNVPLLPTFAEGYLGIVGQKGKSLATFCISDNSVCKSMALAISFDICCEIRQQVEVTLVCDFGDSNETYHQTAEIVGDGKWQRITVEDKNFRRVGDGRQMPDDAVVEMVIIHAEEEFIVNNIYLV